MDIVCHAQLHFTVELQIIDIRYMTYQFKRNPNTISVSKIICTCTTIFLKFYNKCVNKNESGHHSSSCWYFFYHVIFYVATSKGQHWNRIWVTTDTQRWQYHQYFLIRIYSTRTITRRRSQGLAPGLSSSRLIDWLIDWCLTSSEQFFSYIQDENI